jgi:hypothetical protein
LPAGKEHSGNVTGMEDLYGELRHPQRQELTDQGDSENIIGRRALPHAELGRWLNVIARMKYITPFVLCGFLFGCGRGGPTTPQGRLTSGLDKLANAKTAEARF